MEQYSIWHGNGWVKVERAAAMGRLGEPHATFQPLDTMFMDLFLRGTLCQQPIVAFSVNNEGDKLYAHKKDVIKLDHDEKNWEYCIRPADFFDTESTRSVELALGNPKALEIRI